MIRNKNELKSALNRLDEIWSVAPGSDGWVERCTLVEEISEYEDREAELAPPDPVDAITFRMEQAGLRSKKDVV